MRIKHFLIATAVTEGGTGLALALAPAVAAPLLLGVALDPPATVIARVTGTALVAITLACWFARDAGPGRATTGLIAGMLVYDVGAAGLLAHAGLALHLAGPALWPAVAFHAAMSAWCVACLRSGR